MSYSLTTRTTRTSPTTGALRIFLATAAVALAAGLSQTALAAPYEGYGMHGGPGSHGMGMGAGMGMGGGMGGGMGMAGSHPYQMERMLDAVQATPEQRAAVNKILQAARADGQAQREAGRKLHEQTRALFAQPTVDARAAEALRQQMLAQHDQASKRMMQVKLDVSAVLTPEQRKALADRMGQRRAMMERHRAEREGVERAPR